MRVWVLMLVCVGIKYACVGAYVGLCRCKICVYKICVCVLMLVVCATSDHAVLFQSHMAYLHRSYVCVCMESLASHECVHKRELSACLHTYTLDYTVVVPM
jgi:hypothetical protein